MIRFFSLCRASLAVVCLSAVSATWAASLDRVVAVVNNEVITRLELGGKVDAAIAQLTRTGTAAPSRAQVEKQVLERLVLERIQLQQARELGVRIDELTLQRALQTIADNNRLSVADLRRAVENNEKIPWERFREDIRNEVTLARLREREVDSRVVVTEGEVDAFLASPQGAMSGREFLVSHILLRARDGATEQDWRRLQARAAEVNRLIAQGDDFGKLAAAFSDAQDAMQGGSLDWRTPDRLPSLIAERLVDMKKGAISPVLRSSAGLHIFKLVDVRDMGSMRQQQVEQTLARHILIRTSDVPNEAEALRRLSILRERLISGADFAELARAHSTDTSSAKGGDLGWLAAGETVPEFERAMNALKPGEISGVVKSQFGWHLIQVQERRLADVTEERRRQEARMALRDRKSQESYEEWLRQLRDQAYVEIKLD